LKKKEYILRQAIDEKRNIYWSNVEKLKQAEMQAGFPNSKFSIAHEKKPNEGRILGLNFYINQDIWIKQQSSLFFQECNRNIGNY